MIADILPQIPPLYLQDQIRHGEDIVDVIAVILIEQALSLPCQDPRAPEAAINSLLTELTDSIF